MCTKLHLENLNEKDSLEDLGVDGEIIWKEVIK